MIIITDNDKNCLKTRLTIALIKFSNGKLDENKAIQISNMAIDNFDFSNSALCHKGINWYAKEILNLINIKTNKY